MGNYAIIIRGVGQHHNNLSHDADRLAARLVRELHESGHNVLSAHLECGGSTDLQVEPDPAAAALRDPERHGREAYERYLFASGGVSLISGAELPGFDALDERIRQAWIAAATPGANRIVR